MTDHKQYTIIVVIVFAIFFTIFYSGSNKFNFQLPDLGLNEKVEDDIVFAVNASEEAKEWHPDATLQALIMIDGGRPLGEWEIRRVAVYGRPDKGEHYMVKANNKGKLIPAEYETTFLDVGNALDLSEFKVSSQDAFNKAHKKARGIQAGPEDDVSINLTLIDDNGRLVWNYLLIVQRKEELKEGEPYGTVLFVTMDARSGRILNEQKENL